MAGCQDIDRHICLLWIAAFVQILVSILVSRLCMRCYYQSMRSNVLFYI